MPSGSYTIDKTALLLVDYLNDFLDENGKLAPEIGPMLATLGLRKKYEALIAGARKAGIKIFYVPHGVDEHSFDDVPILHPRIQHGMNKKVVWKGEWGDEFYPPLKPMPGDVIVDFHRQYNGFMKTDLEAQLRANGIERVILTGHTTHTCVEGTGRHALEAGFHVTYLKDAVAEFSEPPHHFALKYSYPKLGHAMLTIDEFLASISKR